MYNTDETEPQKISKSEKKEQKKVEKAADRIGKEILPKSHVKLAILSMGLMDFLIFAGVLLLTSSVFAIILTYGYVMIITLIAVIPIMIEEYKRVGRTPPKIVTLFNSMLEKIFPLNRSEMRLGPSVILCYTYLLTIGGFVAIGFLVFADFITNNPNFYDYMINGAPAGEYGFFSFVNNSMINSLVPSILWYLIIFIPAIFCFLFLISSIYYRSHSPSKMMSVVTISPLIILFPLYFTASSINSPSISIALIFVGAWLITILIWYRDITKRNALILFATFFTQVLASNLMIYGLILSQVAFNAPAVSGFSNPVILLIWFAVLVLIPIVLKIFDKGLNGKLKILGPLVAVGLAILFQFYFFPLFSESVYSVYPGQQQLAEIYIGFGFFYFYIALLLIPLFFIFGYFQIGIARWLYRSVRNYGEKIKRISLFKFLGALLAIILVFGLIVIYYIIPYTTTDYQNMFTQTASLFTGNIIARLTDMASATPVDLGEVFQVTTLAITMGLLAYSSYRGAYNFALYRDKIEDPSKSIKRLGIFNFIIFTDPRSYKTRITFGISLIFVFLGISTIFAFLKVHSILFPELGTLANPNIILFETIDAIKLAISIVGMIIAVCIFFYLIFQRKKV